MKKNIGLAAVAGLCFLFFTFAGAHASMHGGLDNLQKKEEIAADGFVYILYGPDNVPELDYLLSDVVSAGPTSPDLLSAKMEEIRETLFPDLELRLDIIPEKPAQTEKQADLPRLSVAGGITLKKSIYWWNKKSGRYGVWYHCEQSSAASCFVQNLEGENQIWWHKNSTWSQRSTRTGLQAWAGSTHGYWQWRCFGAAGMDNNNRANAVMYFYDVELD